jgi:hypothetical protein
LHPEFDGSDRQRLGPHVATSRLESESLDSIAAELGDLSRTTTLKPTAAMTTAARAAEIQITVLSPRAIFNPSTLEQRVRRRTLALIHSFPQQCIAVNRRQ